MKHGNIFIKRNHKFKKKIITVKNFTRISITKRK